MAVIVKTSFSEALNVCVVEAWLEGDITYLVLLPATARGLGILG